MFEQDNIAKDKETHQSKSNEILLETLGGTDAVVNALKTNAKVSRSILLRGGGGVAHLLLSIHDTWYTQRPLTLFSSVIVRY